MFLCGWDTYFFIEKYYFSSLGFFSVLEGSRLFLCFCFFQSCVVFIQSSAFFDKVLHFSYKHLHFFDKVVRIFFKVLLRMFTNFLSILLVCARFHFWGFLWAWNLYTFGVDTIVRWYTNTGSVGFFSSFFSLAIVHFQVYFCNCSRFITMCNDINIILFYTWNISFSTVLYIFKPKIYSENHFPIYVSSPLHDKEMFNRWFLPKRKLNVVLYATIQSL